jgi:hypothetical protein
MLLVAAAIGLPALAESPAAAPGPFPEAEPAICRSPFSTAATDMAPQALLAHAEHCTDPAVATLLRNRAEHARQLRGLEIMSQLLRQAGNTDRARLSQCRLYTALAEAFAERMQREEPGARAAALAQLNLAYEQAIYIAERTIQGHERIVGLPASPR